MTKNEVIDIVHRTILGFFDVVADDSEEPISEKDKLLLEINKAVCNAIKEMPDEERKTGRWEFMGDCWRCSACGRYVYDNMTVDENGKGYDYRLCPACGAEMKGSEKDAKQL